MRPTFKFAVLAPLILTLISLGSIERAHAKEETLEIKTSSFTAGGEIPKKYTADAEDVSPQISIGKLPSATKTLALSCEDPDAPVGTWFHWLIWNMPLTKTQLSEGTEKKDLLQDGSMQGQNDFKKTGYNGPSPPKGPAHHYHFKVFALDKKLDLKAKSDKKEFYKAIEGHVLGTGEVVGIYGRK